jgi:phosphatidylglycerol:prolipoprotein diacylglycerol transferase
MNRAKYEGLTTDEILDYAIFVIPLAVIGARMYYVLTSLDKYDSFKEMLNFREGGLAIYGAVIGGALTAMVVSLVKKVKILKMYDMLVPAVMIGQMIGRWGNFVNAEAFGEQTDIFIRMGIRSGYMTEPIYVHPTFLYESLWNLLGFLLINAYYKKKKYHGEIFFMYIAWYGIGRFFIEGLRTDSLYVGPFRISQVIGIVSFIVGAFFLVYMHFKKGKNAQPILEIENNNKNKEVKKENENGKDN